MTTTTKAKPAKKIYLELMRVLAIIFVIFNHTGADGFFLFADAPIGSAKYWIYMLLSVFCKFSVPLFFAISGALLLGRQKEPLKKLWSKRILKISVILFVFSIIYAVNNHIVFGNVYTIKDFIKTLYSSYFRYHLWYLYLYLAFLISLPFLQALAQNLENQHFYYLFGIALIFKSLPLIQYFIFQGDITMNSNLIPSWLISNVVLYPLIGYFLEHRLDFEMVKSKLGFLWLFNLILLGIECFGTHYKGLLDGQLNEGSSQVFHNCYSFVTCIVIFLTAKYIMTKIPESTPVNQVLISLGSCTFGIYLIHPLIKDFPAFDNLMNSVYGSSIPHMVGAWICVGLLFIISYGITWLLKKIPVLRELVGG